METLEKNRLKTPLLTPIPLVQYEVLENFSFQMDLFYSEIKIITFHYYLSCPVLI